MIQQIQWGHDRDDYRAGELAALRALKALERAVMRDEGIDVALRRAQAVLDGPRVTLMLIADKCEEAQNA